MRLNSEIHRIFSPGLRTVINATADDLPEWIQLAPYGEWPTRERGADGKPEAVQIFTREDAASLVKRFNAWHMRLARLARINSCKMYVGHPDFAPDIWPVRTELADVTALQDDDHGINGRMRWNADVIGTVRKNCYPSVAWDTEVISEGKERPVMLWSVGMTSRPNIKGVKSAINANPETEPPTPEDNPMNLVAQIKALLITNGLLKETDADEAILTGVNATLNSVIWQRQVEARNTAMCGEIKTALNSAEDKPFDELFAALVTSHTSLSAAAADRETRINAATAEVTTLNERINALTAERDEARTARINAELSRLVETGRLTKAEADADGAESVRARLNANTDKTLKELNAVLSRLNTEGLKIGGQKPAIMDARDRMTRINAWTDKYMAEKSVGYDEAYKAAEAATELKPLFEAMKAAAPAA